MESTTQVISSDTDLVYSPDDNGYYLQQYKNDGKGTTRNSIVYTSQDVLLYHFKKNTVKWQAWDQSP